MSKDAFLSIYDEYINKVYSHFYKASADKERALNYTFIFFAKVWDHCLATDDRNIVQKIEALLQGKTT